MRPSISRRRLLAGTGVVATAALAGCPVVGGRRYSLESRPENGAEPTELFEWRPASNAVHYERADAERLADELRETGSVDSVEIPLVEPRGTGESGYRPAYTEHEGTHYRVRVTGEPVTVQRWVVWMEPLDEVPAGVDPVRSPLENRSEFDARVLERAIDRARSSMFGGDDHAAKPAYDRGFVFFEPLDPEDSDLIPDPPFEYARVEFDDHFEPEEATLRLHVDTEDVETTRYTHELEAVAEDRSAFVEHLRAEHVAASFQRDELSTAERDVLASSRALTGYDEAGSLSSAFESVLAALELDSVSLPQGREVASWLRYYNYDGDYYETELSVSDTSLVDVELGDDVEPDGSQSGLSRRI